MHMQAIGGENTVEHIEAIKKASERSDIATHAISFARDIRFAKKRNKGQRH